MHRYSPTTDVIYSICHRVALVIKHSIEKVRVLSVHVDMLNRLYTLFSTQINSQIFEGVSDLDEHKSYKIVNVISKQFNHVYQPAGRVQANYVQILKALQVIKDSDNNAEAKIQWKYWSSFQTLITNGLLLSYTAKCNQLVCSISTANIDIISVFWYVRRFRQMGVSLKAKIAWTMRDMYLNALKANLTFYKAADNVEKVRLKGGFAWNVKQTDSVLWYNETAAKLGGHMLQQFAQYFPTPELRFYDDLAEIFDPHEFCVYPTLDQAAGHGVQAIRRIVATMNNRRDDLGQRVGFNLSTQQLLSEYEVVTKIAYQMRTYEPHRVEKRIARLCAELLKQRALFDGTVSLLCREMTHFPTQVDVERDFSIRAWLLQKQRMKMEDDLFESIMRLILNAPREELQAEDFKEFIMMSVINWHRLKDRGHKIELLKVLSDRYTYGDVASEVYAAAASDL